MYQTKNMGLNITEMPKDTNMAFSFHTDLGYNFEAIDNQALSHRNIANCILEVPQNIKLELADGNISLKEGSTVYIPNGVGNFNTFDISYDIPNSSFDKNGTKQVMLFFNPGTERLDSYTVGLNIFSSESAPSISSLYGIWYDGINNTIKSTDDSGWNWQELSYSLPVGIVTITNGLATKIDQVFNHIGNMGTTIFALPGIKCLMADGRNTDKSLKNIEYTIPNVATYTWDYMDGTFDIFYTSSNRISENSGSTEYREDTNLLWDNWTNTSFSGCALCKVTVLSGQITEIKPGKPFHAVDYSDYKTKITELEAKIETLQAAVKALQG